MTLPIGTRVKPSLYALRSLRDHYLDQGEASRRSRAKEHHDKEAAKRGTVTAHLTPVSENASPGLEITWDNNGGISHCLDYRVERAE